jgi:hypothetical protein
VSNNYAGVIGASTLDAEFPEGRMWLEKRPWLSYSSCCTVGGSGDADSGDRLGMDMEMNLAQLGGIKTALPSEPVIPC